MGLFHKKRHGLHAGELSADKVSLSSDETTADRYMYDAYSGETIPATARMVAGYPWWTAADWARFQKNQYGDGVLVVQSHTTNRGDVLDIEPGCEWPISSYIEDWITMRKDAGYYRPSVYCSSSNIPAVREATGKYVLGTDYDLWAAEWTGVAHNAYAGSSATQYASNSSWDISYVYDAGWPYRTKPAPKPVPKPVPVSEPELKSGSTGTAVKLLQSLLNKHTVVKPKLTNDGDFGPLTEAGVKQWQKYKKITVDGIVGPVTWATLGSYK